MRHYSKLLWQRAWAIVRRPLWAVWALVLGIGAIYQFLQAVASKQAQGLVSIFDALDLWDAIVHWWLVLLAILTLLAVLFKAGYELRGEEAQAREKAEGRLRDTEQEREELRAENERLEKESERLAKELETVKEERDALVSENEELIEVKSVSIEQPLPSSQSSTEKPYSGPIGIHIGPDVTLEGSSIDDNYAYGMPVLRVDEGASFRRTSANRNQSVMSDEQGREQIEQAEQRRRTQDEDQPNS